MQMNHEDGWREFLIGPTTNSNDYQYLHMGSNFIHSQFWTVLVVQGMDAEAEEKQTGMARYPTSEAYPWY